MISSEDKKDWNSNFERLGFNLTRGSHRRCSIKNKVFLKLSQYSQEKNCARVSF